MTLHERHARLLAALKDQLRDIIDTHGGRNAWGCELSSPDHPYHGRVNDLRALIAAESVPLPDDHRATRFVLNSLLDWAAGMGGFDAECWTLARAYRDSLFPKAEG